MAPSMISTRKPAGTIIRTDPLSRRSAIAHRLAADAVPERVDQLAVAGGDADAVAEAADERQRDRRHDVGRAERHAVASGELVSRRRTLQVEANWVATLALHRVSRGGCRVEESCVVI